MLIQNYRCLWTEFYPISSDIIEIGLSHINLFSIDKRYRLCKYQRCVDWCMFKVINLQWQYNDRWIFRKYTSLVAINYMCLNKRNLKNTFATFHYHVILVHFIYAFHKKFFIKLHSINFLWNNSFHLFDLDTCYPVYMYVISFYLLFMVLSHVTN